jgi:cation:H+ antiporter
MFVASAAVLTLFYWRRGIDRRVAIVCLALYLPTFVLV